MSVQTKITGYWDRRADSYQHDQESQAGAAEYAAEWARIWRSALPKPHADVLDVGTGTGHVALTIAELGHRVTGVDLAEQMLAKAQHNAAARGLEVCWVVGDAVAPDFAEASFDAVSGRYLVWTLREIDRALRNWHALIRPGGRLALVDGLWFPLGMAAFEGMTDHYDQEVRSALELAEASSMEPWLDRVEAAGFVDTQIEPLDDLYRLDSIHGVAPGHELTQQYLITARRSS